MSEQSTFDLLVTEVFWTMEHPLNEELRARFGQDQGIGEKTYNCSMAELRTDLIKLGYDKEVTP